MEKRSFYRNKKKAFSGGAPDPPEPKYSMVQKLWWHIHDPPYTPTSDNVPPSAQTTTTQIIWWLIKPPNTTRQTYGTIDNEQPSYKYKSDRVKRNLKISWLITRPKFK